MEPFLMTVARRILAENKSATEQVLVVFNNHRPELFLRKQFEKISTEEGLTFFMPQTMVIDDLVAHLGGLEVVPPEFLLFELYRIHTELEGEERKYKTFEEFIPFGELMISDFSEVDRYMVDARDLFQNLHRMKEVLEWDVENPTMSEFQRNYLRFYQSLYEYYRRLRQRLTERGQAYSGMAYRSVAERLQNGQWPDESGRLSSGDTIGNWGPRTYFVGFNAISECERRIIGEFVRRGIGHLLTDGDNYYYSDEHQEAGYFLRKHSKEFADLGHYGPSLFATTEKDITIVECPENVLQCKFAGQLLSEHPDWMTDKKPTNDEDSDYQASTDPDAGSTAIVLADESMLMPTLNSLPDVADRNCHVNVTMGYPYSDSQLHTLVLKLLELYRRHNEQGYYHTNVVDVLSDWYINQMTAMKAARKDTERLLKKEDLVRVNASQLATLTTEFDLNEILPSRMLSPDECIDQVLHVASLLATDEKIITNQRERQAMGALVEVMDYLKRLQQEYHFIQNIDTLEKIYLRIAQRHTIAFLGEPLSGLQILGMLETRNLDFHRIILLSAGEGVLPAARSEATLIPHELKRAFNMPTYKERDSVYAYNFYRLLQRAEKIYLVYSSDLENIGKGEESRLLKQVRSELATRYPQTIKVHDWVVATDGKLRHAIEAPTPGIKDTAVMQKLHSIGSGNGFSPSALEIYTDCQLKYYYMKILGLEEQEGVEDDIDTTELGNTVHNVLKDIFEPFVGRRVDAAALRSARSNIDRKLDIEMEHLMRSGRTLEGRNAFIRSVAKTQLERVLEREAAIADSHRLEIVAVEHDYKYDIARGEWHDGDRERLVYIAGRVDRIDRLDGRLRVIDYKTGKLESTEITYTTGGNTIPGKWLQLMCYALMHRRNFPSNENLQVGIYPLRYLRSDVSLARWNNQDEISGQMLNDFEEMLRELLTELLDNNQPFAANPSDGACSFCPVRTFCPARQKTSSSAQ